MRSRNAVVGLGRVHRRVVFVDHRDDRRSSTAGSRCCAACCTFADSAPRMISHMITSAPSSPPRSAYCAIVSSVRRSGSLLEQLEKLHVPGGVVETRALAVHLVREPARGDDRHLEILGVALDRPAQRLAELEAAPRRRNGKLQHADLQRNDGAGPAAVVRPQHRQRREAAVVERLAPGRTTCRTRRPSAPWRCARASRGMPLDRRQIARAAALIGDRILSPTPSAKCE